MRSRGRLVSTTGSCGEKSSPRAADELLTLPALAREYGINVKTIRREAKRGSFPVYLAGTSWPRVWRRDFERWIRSTRAPVSQHAARRLAEVLERERSSTGTRMQEPQRSGKRKTRESMMG